MSLNHSTPICNSSTSYLNATGKLPYNMTNDYLFRIILERCVNMLKALICALLHIPVEEVKEITITNPITPGENITDKEFILDTKVLFNNDRLVNLEMQVVKVYNWPERSLSYLCRSYDQLFHGQDYQEVLPAIHIGFLDYTLFENHKEFYGIYKMLNVKDHYLYSDKLTLGVVDLTQIDLATEEDKSYGIDHWARLFKATTWEEIKMIAENNQTMQEATQTLYELLADMEVQDKCRKRQEYNMTMRHYKQIEAEHAKQQAIIAEQEAALAEMAAENAELLAEIARLKAQQTT